MKCDHQNWNRRKKFRNLPSDIDAIEIRHLVIQENQIGRGFKDLLEGLGASLRLPTHPPGVLLFEDGSQVATNRGIVVD
jgi:hypothetical protein